MVTAPDRPQPSRLGKDRRSRHGEAEGLKISLAGARDKLAQIDRRSRPAVPISIGMPAMPLHTVDVLREHRQRQKKDKQKAGHDSAGPGHTFVSRFVAAIAILVLGSW